MHRWTAAIRRGSRAPRPGAARPADWPPDVGCVAFEARRRRSCSSTRSWLDDWQALDALVERHATGGGAHDDALPRPQPGRGRRALRRGARTHTAEPPAGVRDPVEGMDESMVYLEAPRRSCPATG